MTDVGLSVMPQPEYLAATLPLFETGLVDTIEWSFDMSWRPGLPEWLAGLIHDYEAAGRLAGHGVSLSPLSEHPRQERWFERFGQDVTNHRFTQVSEHFGFMAAGDFRLGPPMPLPMTNETLRIGIAHLQRLTGLTDGPVGLENLAFAFGDADVWTQGDFLDSLLAPVDGFLVLDVHNLWCQLVNFDLDIAELLATYPVDRVRECHVSGGSWNTTSIETGERSIRRDTHDASVPPQVFATLETVLAVCPNVETVVVEQIGDAFETAEAGLAFRQDYERVCDIVAADRNRVSLPSAPPRAEPTTDPVFAAELMQIMHVAGSADEAMAALSTLDAATAGMWSQWVGAMQPAMVETAIELMATWAQRN